MQRKKCNIIIVVLILFRLMQNQTSVALQLKNVTKIYPNGTVANKAINFKVSYGQIHALFGENGSGKTTLVKNILGENQITKGQMFIDSQLLANHTPENAKAVGIAAVRQHFALIDNFSVFENVILGCERKTRSELLKIEKEYEKRLTLLEKARKEKQAIGKEKEFLQKMAELKKWKEEESTTWLCYRNEIKEEVTELINKFKLGIKIERIVDELSVNKKQKTEILKVLFRAAKVVIFDEPTSLISVSEIQQLLELLLMYKKMGKAVIFISHKVEEIRKIADWVTVLRKGEVVGSVDVKKITNEELVSLMVGKQKLSDLAQAKTTPVQKRQMLQIKNLSLRSGEKWLLNEVNFEVKRGEIVGIAGLEENGQKELLETIVRIDKRGGGHILFQDDVALEKLSAIEVRDHHIAYVPQDRQKQSLVLDENLIFNTYFNNWGSNHFFRFGLINYPNIVQRAQRIINNYRVQGVTSLQERVANLSGGNQQKFVIGRELETQPQLLLLHEPMWGIDVKTINYLSKILIDFRNRGNSVLFASSELNDLLTLSDRVLVISKGHIMGEVNPRNKHASQQIGELMTKEVV